ncbi:hypothetical protein TWF506_010680 [Arthrobotrys conoides]|uniref:Protein kinase domain-containing protein n=1 Tax=Arthrobotrys conoides TaxID=74498 RepID=A0AAN8NRZ8_9PEZI
MNLSQFLNRVTPPEIQKTVKRSTTKTTAPAHPREYLADLTPWTGIDEDIKKLLDPHLNHSSRRFLRTAEVIEDKADTKSVCGNESDVVALGGTIYEDPTLAILREVFSIRCDFANHRATNNIGDPDRVFYVFNDQVTKSRAKFLMEWKTPWALKTPTNIITHFNRQRENRNDKIVKAISQLYGYMTFNNLIHGGLCNYEALYLLRRTGDTGLQITRPFLYSERGIRGPIAALTYICHYSATKESFHYSPVAGGPPGVHTFVLDDLEIEGTWDKDIRVPWTNMNLRLYNAISKNIASVMSGEVVPRQGTIFKYQKTAFFKVYDITQPSNLEAADAEIKSYTDLKALQGKYIPMLYAAGATLKSLKFLVLEDCGKTASDENIDRSFWGHAQKAIDALHARGRVHGDLKLENFAVSNGIVRLIDLGACRPAPEADRSEERSSLCLLKGDWEEKQVDGAD